MWYFRKYKNSFKYDDYLGFINIIFKYKNQMIWNKKINILSILCIENNFFYLNLGFNYDATMTYRLITR